MTIIAKSGMFGLEFAGFRQQIAEFGFGGIIDENLWYCSNV
jgi:hypothetical protein